MKLPIAAIVAAALTLGAAVTGYVVSHDSSQAQSDCADGCTISTHQMTSMGNMAGMQAAPAPVSSTDPASGASINPMSMPMHGGHMQMTPPRATTQADRQRADQIVAALRTAIQPYKDYRAAEAAGYAPFLRNIPQPIYHFTNMHNALLNEFSFDPTRPTSLMYKSVSGGYELVGAMYTAPRASTLDQLNDRVPLSVATWHLHVNLCMPPQGMEREMFQSHPQFGLAGSITDAQGCAAAGGRFKPAIYNWMLHVWPFETDPSKVWASEDHPGAMEQ